MDTCPALECRLDIYNFFGSRIGIRSNSEEILSHFRSVYGRFYAPEPALRGTAEGRPSESHCIIEAIDRINHDQELTIGDGLESYTLRCKSLYEFDRDYYGQGTIPDPIAFVTYLFLKNQYRMIKRFRLFHAAALSRNGRAVVLPALERMGKTTLSVQLVKAGFKFLSDELACINPENGRVEPYPRKINLNASSCALLGIPEWPDQFQRRSGTDEVEWALDIEQLVPTSLSPACPLAHIIFLRGFGEVPSLEPVSSSNALFRLFRLSFNPDSRPGAQLYQFASVLEGVSCFNLVCADPTETARILTAVVDAAAASWNRT